MAFNLAKFEGAVLEPRQEVMRAPMLATWFEKGDAAEITVRSLTGIELARMREGPGQEKMLAALIEAKAGDTDAMKSVFGLSKDTPAEASKHIEMLCIGIVSPELNRHAIIKIYESFPVFALQLVSKISQLSDLGAEPGKQRRSGVTEKSEQH